MIHALRSRWLLHVSASLVKFGSPHRCRYARNFVWPGDFVSVERRCAAQAAGPLVRDVRAGCLYHRHALFAELTVLASYQLVSGWRCAHTRQQGPAWIDALWTVLAVVITFFLWPIVTALEPGSSTQPTVIYSSLASLAFVLGYDALRWLFPRRWFASLWLYEHVYKLLASFAALTSAFAGNVIRAWHPWSQILPSAVCLALIAGYFYLLTTGKWKAHQGQAK
jgi:hypothetical protein